MISNSIATVGCNRQEDSRVRSRRVEWLCYCRKRDIVRAGKNLGADRKICKYREERCWKAGGDK